MNKSSLSNSRVSPIQDKQMKVLMSRSNSFYI